MMSEVREWRRRVEAGESRRAIAVSVGRCVCTVTDHTKGIAKPPSKKRRQHVARVKRVETLLRGFNLALGLQSYEAR